MVFTGRTRPNLAHDNRRLIWEIDALPDGTLANLNEEETRYLHQLLASRNVQPSMNVEFEFERNTIKLIMVTRYMED